VEFLLVAEEVLDNLGEGQVARQEAAHQLIYDIVVGTCKAHKPTYFPGGAQYL